MTQQPSTPSVPAAPSALRSFRRAAVIVIIVSLSATALIGIVTLITGAYGELQGKIMLTTLTIGATSVVALCDLAVLGKRIRLVGIAGLLAAAVTLVTTLILIWGVDSSDVVVKAFGLAAIAAASIAHANLLLLLSERRRAVVRGGLWATVSLIALLLVLLCISILSDGEVWGGVYAKLVGTVAILDVLGTIVVPVVSLFLKDDGAGRRGAEQAGTALNLTVPPALAVRLAREAQEAGTTAEQFAIDAITRSLDARGSVEPSATQ